MKRRYPTDLSDAEWEYLELHVPAPNKRGRPKTHTTREILNAIFYILKSGCAWLGQNRRMSKDYERLCATSEAFVYAAMTRVMVRRLAYA
jgi:hypothetical protein